MTQQRGNRETSRRRPPRSVEAEYIKSPLCRVIHVDGAYGGATGTGFLYMALYSEHTKLPRKARFAINEATKDSSRRAG